MQKTILIEIGETRHDAAGSVVGARDAPPRLQSLDVLRGLAVAIMILVNTSGDGAHTYPILAHSGGTADADRRCVPLLPYLWLDCPSSSRWPAGCAGEYLEAESLFPKVRTVHLAFFGKRF